MTDAPPRLLTSPSLAEEDIAEQKAVRLAKRERLIAEGDDAYPVAVPVTHTIPQVRERWENLETDATTGGDGRRRRPRRPPAQHRQALLRRAPVRRRPASRR